jgi:hypothetical protein
VAVAIIAAALAWLAKIGLPLLLAILTLLSAIDR